MALCKTLYVQRTYNVHTFVSAIYNLSLPSSALRGACTNLVAADS